jgi:hypothetical protein
MEPERPDQPAPAAPSATTWLDYYAEASRRRRARGWHRRRRFIPHRRRWARPVIVYGALLALAALVTMATLIFPRPT